jgi:hypothetical protein
MDELASEELASEELASEEELEAGDEAVGAGVDSPPPPPPPHALRNKVAQARKTTLLACRTTQ